MLQTDRQATGTVTYLFIVFRGPRGARQLGGQRSVIPPLSHSVFVSMLSNEFSKFIRNFLCRG